MSLSQAQDLSCGDRHNFGRFVQSETRAASKIYCKPRTTFWEHFFFGQKSPLLNVFRDHDFPELNKLSEEVFRLNCIDIKLWYGEVAAFLPNDKNSNNVIGLQSFGRLLAYVYSFGIFDLHQGNLIKSDGVLQPIDCEVVFGNMILPHESLLLPFLEIDASRCGFSKLGFNIHETSKNDLAVVIDSFISTLIDIAKANKKIIEVTTDALSAERIPIRIILRSTFKYRDFLSGETVANPGLLDEELMQLHRGDIPYFFKFYGNENLYWFKKSFDQATAVTSSPEWIIELKSKYNFNINDLLSDTRITNQLIPHGVLFILKKYLKSSVDYSNNCDDYSYGVHAGKYFIRSSSGEWHSK